MRKSAKHTPRYPPEFRAEATRLARTSGKPCAQIARELGLTGETLRLWIKQADLDEGKRHDGLTSEEQAELRLTAESIPRKPSPSGAVTSARRATSSAPMTSSSFSRTCSSGEWNGARSAQPSGL